MPTPRALRDLVQDRLADAEAALDAGRFSAAYYLSGYAAEAALKVCLLKRLTAVAALDLMPEKALLTKAYTHSLDDLVALADLTAYRAQREQASPAFRANWATAREWNESARYMEATEQESRDLYGSLTEAGEGVLEWIKSHW